MLKKRNIVLITLDSLRADHCSFMGYRRKTTPTIDKMAEKGLCFENAIASGVATPTSMFGIFTGDYPHASFEINRLDGNEWRKEISSKQTLAQFLRKKGYFTGAIHANPGVSRFFGFNRGFNYFKDFMDERKENRVLARLFSKLKLYSFYMNLRAVIKKEATSTDSRKLIPEVINFKKKAKEPYLLWVLLLETHIPYIAPKNFRKWGSKYTINLIYQNWKIRRNYMNPSRISESDRKKIIDAYDDTIFYADKIIQELWHILEESDPIFIIHADHGEGFGEHGFYYHPPMLYEELIHVPLIVYNADIEKGKRKKPVSLLGVAPSILELIGEKNEFPSRSFLNDGEDWVISKVFNGSRWKIAIRTERWKFIVGQKEEDELFYLKDDPLEQRNVVDRYPELANEMRKIIKLHLSQESKKAMVRDKIKKIRLK